VAYWTGALVVGGQAADRPGKGPGTNYWRERYGERTLAGYFESYFKEALAAGADGVFFHSICRLCGLPSETQAETITAVKRLYKEMVAR
jgi:hypothetical protein